MRALAVNWRSTMSLLTRRMFATPADVPNGSLGEDMLVPEPTADVEPVDVPEVAGRVESYDDPEVLPLEVAGDVEEDEEDGRVVDEPVADELDCANAARGNAAASATRLRLRK